MVEDKIAAWLHEVELAPGSERQQAIASAAATYAASATSSGMPDLVLLAHRVPAPAAFEHLTGLIKDVDSTFAGREDELETHLAAAITVASVMERNTRAATTAASLVLNAAATALTSPVADLTALADETRHRRGGSVRSRGAIQSSLDPKGIFGRVPSFDQDGVPVQHQEVRLLRQSSMAALDATAKSLVTLTSRLANRLNAADEELDLLWWCFAERSTTLDEQWAHLPSSGLAAVVAAFEMHSLLQFPSEPQASRALLARVLGDRANDKIPFHSAISDTCKAAEIVAEMGDGHQLLPVLSSLREYRLLDGKSAWKSSVGRWGIKPTRSWRAVDLACECLRELIVLENIS